MSPRAALPVGELTRRAQVLRVYAEACRKDLDLARARERALQAALDGELLEPGERGTIHAARSRAREERARAALAWQEVVGMAEQLELRATTAAALRGAP